MAEITSMQRQCGHKNEKVMMNQGYAALILALILGTKNMPFGQEKLQPVLMGKKLIPSW